MVKWQYYKNRICRRTFNQVQMGKCWNSHERHLLLWHLILMFRREMTEQAKTKYLMICVNIEKQREKSATQWSLESLFFLIICSQVGQPKCQRGCLAGVFETSAPWWPIYPYVVTSSTRVSHCSSFKISAAMLSTCPKDLAFVFFFWAKLVAPISFTIVW